MQKKSTVFSLILLLFAANYGLAQQTMSKSSKPAASVSKYEQKDFQQTFFGKVDEKSYKNEYFGIKVTIPETWLAQESEIGKTIKETGRNSVKGKTEQSQKSFDEAVQRVTVLFTASKDILGMENNAIMVLAAEKKPPLLQFRNGEDYLRLTLQSFKKLQLPPDYKYSETIESEKFGSETFYSLNIQRNGYSQRLYATYRKGYALFFTFIYINDKDLETMKSILRESDFNWKE